MNIKRRCPQCQSERRKNPNDKPLSFDTTTGLFHCFHCGWKGKEGASDYEYPRVKRYRKPDYTPVVNENEKLLAWFAARGISAEVVRRHRIEARTEYMPQTERDERVICFPYFENGEVVNVKYRSVHPTDKDRDKKFKMEAEAELILYGVDGIDWTQPLIICEGEPDKLAFETAGLKNCVSVPNGTGTNLSILAKYELQIETVPKIYVACDGDEAGRKFQPELIRRLGAEKCWRVDYPEGCKDANDVLVKYGVECVQELLEYARPMPIEGVFTIDDVLPDLIDLYRNGRPQGEFVGWDNLAKLYKPRLGTWTVVTGSPNAGKSPFLRAMMVNLAISAGWRFAVFPPEDCPPAQYYSFLTQIYTGMAFDAPFQPRMTESQMLDAAEWVRDKFTVINPSREFRTQEAILDKTKSCILRHGSTALVLDPFNRLAHRQPKGQTQDQYICGLLGEYDSFIKTNNMHGFYVAHPTKLKKENGVYPVATMYDISGSSHWFNMPDFGISVWRNKAEKYSPLEVHVQKVKNSWCGELGMAELQYDYTSGRFTEDGIGFRHGVYADTNEYGGVQ